MTHRTKWMFAAGRGGRRRRPLQQRHFLYALCPTSGETVYIDEGFDLDALQERAKRDGLKGVRIMTPGEGDRLSADFFVQNFPRPADDDEDPSS